MFISWCFYYRREYFFTGIKMVKRAYELAVRRVCCLLQTLVRGRITLAQRGGVILYTRVYEKSLRPMFTDRAWTIRIDCPSLSLFYWFSINKQTEQQETADVCVYTICIYVYATYTILHVHVHLLFCSPPQTVCTNTC